MKVIIVGVGRVGSCLANLLDREGHQVTVVDRDALALQRRLAPDFSGTKLVGNAMDQDVLERAEIRRADVLLTITEGDNRNIMIAQIAKVVFGVPKVMARIVDPLRAQAYRELGIDSIDQTTLVSEHMRRVVLGETACEFAGQREE
ncbi:MAG TPA: TrkA family potassium uptake protein [Armatimonadetes bacterium]|jgi:trk system potassium uptake protein TrkA|nr:TrkA family potassium uptake protein [Armatimonadota bacterium]